LSSSVIAVAVGVALPWLTVNPTTAPATPIPAVSLAGMDAGIGIFDGILLAITGVGILLRRCSQRRWVAAGVTLLTGLGVGGFCVLYLSTSALVGFDATFVPAPGWYLSLVGGLTLALTGGAGLLGSRRFRGMAPATD